MVCALRSCGYAVVIGLFVCAQTTTVSGKAGKIRKAGKEDIEIPQTDSTEAPTTETLTTEAPTKEEAPTAAAPTDSVSQPQPPSKFEWKEHNKLSWNDFQGPVSAGSDAEAAATHCSIGFETGPGEGRKPAITVYNNFYVNKSWVREDSRIPSILVHEQGHFDLCEIYTRLLRARMNNVAFSPNFNKELMATYDQLSREYEVRQESYERETTHGINIPAQKRWTETISRQLNAPADETEPLSFNK